MQELLPRRKNVNAYGVYIFSGKGPTFSASCKTSEHYFTKPVNTILRKDEKAMVQIKRDWFNIEFFIYERGWHYGRWKEKIQI